MALPSLVAFLHFASVSIVVTPESTVVTGSEVTTVFPWIQAIGKTPSKTTEKQNPQ
jgi:hypothetical protein